MWLSLTFKLKLEEDRARFTVYIQTGCMVISTMHGRFLWSDESVYGDSIVWTYVLHWTELVPPDAVAGFPSIAALFLSLSLSAELQLESATKSESYWHTHTLSLSLSLTAARDGNGLHSNIPLSCSELHQQQVHRGRGGYKTTSALSLSLSV